MHTLIVGMLAVSLRSLGKHGTRQFAYYVSLDSSRLLA